MQLDGRPFIGWRYEKLLSGNSRKRAVSLEVFQRYRLLRQKAL